MNNTPQNLVWLGTPFFAPKLKDYGWKNVHIHYFPSFQVFGWEDILEMAGFEPDVMVYGDCSRPPFILGMEIDARHRVSHRAKTFTENVERVFSEGIASIVERRLKNAGNVRKQCLALPYLHWANVIGNPEASQPYLAAARGCFQSPAKPCPIIDKAAAGQ